MPVKLGVRADHGFDQPLGLLSDCHRRIEHFLGVLEKVARQCAGGVLGEEHRRAVEGALKYFDQAAPRHTMDEEESLFPVLRRMEDPRVQEALRRIDALEADHKTAGAGHAQVRELFQQWLDAGSLPPDKTEQLLTTLGSLQGLYQHHIGVEDTEIFPLAAKVLSPEQVTQLGQAMAKRRGLG